MNFVLHTAVWKKCADSTIFKRDTSPFHPLVAQPSQQHPETVEEQVYQNKWEEQAYQNKWIIPALIAIGAFMTTLDSSIVNISLPSEVR